MKIMRYLKRIASVFTLAILGMWVLTSCEGADLYNVGAPDWISDKVDSIANSKTSNVISVGLTLPTWVRPTTRQPGGLSSPTTSRLNRVKPTR